MTDIDICNRAITDWPEAARPKDVWRSSFAGVPFTSISGVSLPDHLAVQVFESAGLRWLLRLPTEPPIQSCVMMSQLKDGYMLDTSSPHPDPRNVYSLDNWNGYNPTLLAAIDTAIRNIASQAREPPCQK